MQFTIQSVVAIFTLMAMGECVATYPSPVQANAGWDAARWEAVDAPRCCRIARLDRVEQTSAPEATTAANSAASGQPTAARGGAGAGQAQVPEAWWDRQDPAGGYAWRPQA